MTKPTNPLISVSNFNTESCSGTTHYIDIDIFKFIRDTEATDSIVVQILEGEDYIYIDEFLPEPSLMGHIGLLVMAQEWIINHVRIV